MQSQDMTEGLCSIMAALGDWLMRLITLSCGAGVLRNNAHTLRSVFAVGLLLKKALSVTRVSHMIKNVKTE